MRKELRKVLTILTVLLVVTLTAFGQGKGKVSNEAEEPTAGNNLSYPVVWADANYTKALRGTPGMLPITNGAWWWWWGVIPGGEGAEDVPLSCAPDPDNNAFCDDGIIGTTTGGIPGEGYPADALRKVYLQKDLGNTWQAETHTVPEGASIVIDWIDWSDSLEAKDWSLSSQVRVEHVLYSVAKGGLQYFMRHTSGWGTDEVHGISVDPVWGTIDLFYHNDLPTLYSACARLTIQSLNVSRDDPLVETLTWDPVSHQWVGSVIKAPIFNDAVYEAADGPGYYNAEINVKGKIIYGYTWNVKNLNQGVADYRITFSFDSVGCTAPDNTLITPATQIILPEEGVVAEEEPDLGGGVAVLRPEYNLTYMDVRIGSQKGGGGSKKK